MVAPGRMLPFASGKKLNLVFRGIAALLYLLASIMLINRFYRSVDTFGVFSSALRESGIDLYDAGSNLVPSLRLLVFVIGTGASIFFMVLPQKGLTAKSASTD